MNITDKEREILEYLAEGLPRSEIAQKVLSNETTVNWIIYDLRGRFGCRNANALISLFERNGRNIEDSNRKAG